MKILLITDLYPIKEEENYTPKVLKKFVEDWKELGHEVSVLKPNFLPNSFLRNKPYYKTGWYGEVYNINFLSPFLFKGNTPNINYDVIIAHMPSGIIYSKHFSGKLICAVHCSDLEVLQNPIYSFYFKSQMEKAYKRAVGIACRSEIIKRKFLKLYPQFEEKTFVISSGVDMEIFNHSDKTLNRDCMKVITCANLIKRKNTDILIEALKPFDNMQLTVIGDGKLRKKLQKSDKKVVFTGNIKKEKVYEYMKNSDIFILPSVNETFGMVYLEAMACGCITVGIKNEGIDGILKDGVNGFLINPKSADIEELINKIKSMSDESIKNLLKNCYNTAMQYKSKDCSSKYIDNVIKKI